MLADIRSRCRGIAVLQLKIPVLWGVMELGVGVVRDLLVDEGDVGGVSMGGGCAVGGDSRGGFVLGGGSEGL